RLLPGPGRGRAGPARGARPLARPDRRPRRPPAPGVAPCPCRGHAVPGPAVAHLVPARRAARPGGRDLQALLERVPPGRGGHRRRPAGSGRHRPVGQVAEHVDAHRRPRSAEPAGELGRDLLHVTRRHDLRRDERDPAQHHRRDRAGPGQGTREGCSMIGIWNIARVEPDEVAIVEDHTGRSCTRGELAERSHRLVWALRGRGLATGSVLAAVMRNEIEFFEVLLAALQAGWYLVPVNHHFAPREVAYILQDSGAEVVVASASTEALVTEAADAAGLP